MFLHTATEREVALSQPPNLVGSLIAGRELGLSEPTSRCLDEACITMAGPHPREAVSALAALVYPSGGVRQTGPRLPATCMGPGGSRGASSARLPTCARRTLAGRPHAAGCQPPAEREVAVCRREPGEAMTEQPGYLNGPRRHRRHDGTGHARGRAAWTAFLGKRGGRNAGA